MFVLVWFGLVSSLSQKEKIKRNFTQSPLYRIIFGIVQTHQTAAAKVFPWQQNSIPLIPPIQPVTAISNSTKTLEFLFASICDRVWVQSTGLHLSCFQLSNFSSFLWSTVFIMSLYSCKNLIDGSLSCSQYQITLQFKFYLLKRQNAFKMRKIMRILLSKIICKWYFIIK